MRFNNDQSVDTPDGIGRVITYNQEYGMYEVLISRDLGYRHSGVKYYSENELTELHEVDLVGVRY